MTKVLSKWFRKLHRWIAIPTALTIVTAVVINLVGSPALVETWESLGKIPSLLTLFMALTGSYLFLLPYIAKSQRKKKNATVEVMKD